MNRVDEELELEIRDLMARGFKPAWIKDLKVGDIFAGPRIFSFDEPRKLFVVERLHGAEASYLEEDREWVENRVVCMIVLDEDGLERHLSYGHTHEVYIWQS